MNESPNPIAENVSISPLREKNYIISLFDMDYNFIDIPYWHFMEYALTFDESNTTIELNVVPITEILDINRFRVAKYLKIQYTDDNENVLATNTYSILKMTGSTQGGFNSDLLLNYKIQYALK